MVWSQRIRDRRARKALDKASARWNTPRTAFVLSGGGVLGAVQVGQLKALIEAGIIPDAVVATSVGALNGAMVACEPTPEGMEYMAGVWRGLRSEDIFPGSRMARAWNIVARGDHIHPNDGIRRLVEKLPVRTFGETRIPFHVCATNLTTGAETWFDSGPLVRAILAATALPGIFPPVAIDGNLYVDGGVVNNVPVSKAISMGAKRVYVLTCAEQNPKLFRPIRRPIDVLIQAFAHSRAARFEQDLERYGSEVEFVMMPTFEPGPIRYDDPSRSAALIDRAYLESQAFLAMPGAERA